MLFKVLKKFWHFEKLVVRSNEVLGVKMQVLITVLWTMQVFLLNFIMVSGFPLGDTCKVSGSVGNLLWDLRDPRHSSHVQKQLFKCLLYPLTLMKTQHYFRWTTTMNQQWHWFIVLFWRNEREKLNRRKRRWEKKPKSKNLKGWYGITTNSLINCSV